MLTTSELKRLLRAHDLRLTKRLGQHHLVEARVIARIADACQLSRRDTVVEIGAGLGALTEPLAARAGRVIAVEVDKRICALLSRRMSAWRNVSVICQDILDFAWAPMNGSFVVGAIPYHVTSPIFLSLCEHREVIRAAMLIVQEEVAQRLAAAPSTKAYGRLTVFAQYCWEVSVLFRVPRSAFFPQPEVDSCCVQLIARSRPVVAVKNEGRLFELVKAAFSHRRKTLVNCLTGQDGLGMHRAEAEELVAQLRLPRSVRGETLSLDQFAALANALTHTNSLRDKK